MTNMIEGLEKKYIKGGGTLVVLVGSEDIEKYPAVFPSCSFLSLYGFGWEKYLSPWPAEKVFRKADPFEGKAEELLSYLEEELKQYSFDHLVLAGYSLAGLFCAWAATRMKTDGLVCCSASFWYPDFNAYLRDHPLQCSYVYVSLGDKESRSKSPVFSAIDVKTEEACAIMQESCPVVFAWNEGGHFVEDAPRIMKGIACLQEKM